MRILYLNGHPVWTYGLPWGLRQLGHDVKIVKVIQKDTLYSYIKTFKPDLVITVGWIYEYMKAKKLDLIKKFVRDCGCLHAYWATEDITWFKRWSRPLVKILRPDVVFTINVECIKYYQEMGIPAFHLEFGYNPDFEKNIKENKNKKSYDIALVANSYDIWRHPECFRYKSAEILVRPLVERNCNMVICGTGWKLAPWSRIPAANVKYMGTIPFKDTFRVYRNSKIVLNLQNQGEYTTQMTSRTFEIMGCGGFQMTARTPAVEKFFIHGEHLLMSGSPVETVELVDYYLNHESERFQIAARGQSEVLEKHTYDKRAAYMLSCLNSIKEKIRIRPFPPKSKSNKLKK